MPSDFQAAHSQFLPTFPLPANQSRPDLTFGADSDSTDIADNSSIRGKNRLSYDQANRRIVEHGRGLRSFKAPFTRLSVAGNRLITDEGEYHLGHEGRRKLIGHFRAPADYLNRLDPQLSDDILNYHLRTTPSPVGNRIYLRDGELVGLGRSDLHTLDSAEVLNAVRDGFGTDALEFEAQSVEIVNESFSLDLVSPRIAVEVRAGDEIQAGLRIEHSYIGDRATTVSGFAVRLLCTNGLITRECVGVQRRTRRLNADREYAGMLQFDQIRRLAQDVRKQIDPRLEAIKKLANERADEAQLKQFLSQARMNSRGMVQQIGAAWETEGNERTGFGLLNALTRLATHGETLSARQRGTLARLAGIYANRSNHLCPHCFSALNRPLRGESEASEPQGPNV